MLLVSLAIAAEVCTTFADAASAVVIDDLPELESSGVAAARGVDGRFFTHGDHGSEAVLEVFDLDGTWVGPQRIDGATNEDWEDISNGPCPSAIDAEHCLWIGDIGDNDGSRESVVVYAVPESQDASVSAIPCTFQYPDGDRPDAEALLVSPDGTVRIVTKEGGGEAHVYRSASPRCDGETETLIEEASVTIDSAVTGGAMAPDGGSLVLRTYTDAWLWTGCTINWSEAPTRVDLGSEPQGEAIAFTNDGGLVTTSEGTPFRARSVPCASFETATCPTCGCAARSEPGWLGGILIGALLGVRRGLRRVSSGRQRPRPS